MIPEPAERPDASYLRFQAEMPNETWQSDFTHYRLATLPPLLRTYVPATVAVPIVIYGLMPQVHRLPVRLTSGRPITRGSTR